MLSLSQVKCPLRVSKLELSGLEGRSGPQNTNSRHQISNPFISAKLHVRFYAKKQHIANYKAPKKVAKNAEDGPRFHVSKSYRPTVPTPHSLMDDKAAMIAYTEAMESVTPDIPTIEEVRRKANAKKNVEKVMRELSHENEDPLIRQAYEELEDEDRMRRGLAPLKRAPPGKLKIGWDQV